MMQKDMFRRHFNRNYSIAELEQMEQQKMTRVAQMQQQWNQLREQGIAKVLTEEQMVSEHPLAKSKIMFRKHYYQKQCDSCFASKEANQLAGITYQNAMKNYSQQTNPSTVSIPVRPKHIPYVVNVDPTEAKTV